MMTHAQYLTFKQQHPLDSIKASQARDAAFERFAALGLPSKKEEAWKYTSLTYLKQATLNVDQDENSLSHEDMKWVADQLNSDYLNMVFVNGILNKTLSDDADDFIDVTEVDLTDFSMAQVKTEEKMQSLANAFAFQKTVIKVKQQTVLDKIIHLVYVQAGSKSHLINPFVQVDIQAESKAQMIVNYISRDQNMSTTQHVLNADIQVHIGERANLEFLQIQNEGLKHTHVSRVQFVLENSARLVSLDLSLGSAVSRHYLSAQFNGQQAFAGIYGVVALGQDQHSDQYTFIHHAQGHNDSNQKYKSILTDKSQAVFRGRIRIEQDAQKANSQQLNNSLVLSREAHTNSIPQLEIYADDVKASHGSTVGQLNKDEMFYFLSRGIDQIQATQMLAYGFVMEMASVFENNLLQSQVQKTLVNKLNGMLK